MTYIVTDACVRCKFTDCVEVCPAHCFYEGENFLVIHPSECIDCGACESACPVDAIKFQTDDAPDGKWQRINAEFARVWPRLLHRVAPPADADAFRTVSDKFEKYFSPTAASRVS